MNEVIAYLKKILKKKDIIVLGVSGGPDSMCLLDVLNDLKEELDLKIICAHVNHNLRKESFEEKLLVQNYCENHDITFEYMEIDEYPNNQFTENIGRERRYDFFKKIISKYHAQYLMTAHHGDDLIETIMMRIVRGSNLKGYAGIPLISYNSDYTLIRPLLLVTKEEILDYLKERNINYALDKTNELDIHTRNRFRKHMLPFLKKESKSVHKKFMQFSEELIATKDYINRELDKIYPEIVKDTVISLSELIKIDEYLQRKIIERVIEDIQKEYILNISKKEIEIIMEFIEHGSNGQINLADGFIARVSYDKLYIEKEPNIVSYNYEFKDNLEIMGKYKIEKISECDEKSNFILRLNSEEITFPLIVRTRNNGDVIKLKKVGTKKVKDILIDSKIDLRKRKEMPIVTDSKNNILWLPGVKKSIFDKEINEKYDIILKYMEENYE